jgi:branched-chain amino acid transport system substrate-binding protein
MTESLEDRVAALEARNARVENDKAWETSPLRRISIAVITYIVISLLLMAIGHEGAWIHSIVPVLGYLLSTLALHYIRGRWQKKLSLAFFCALAFPAFAHADITLALAAPMTGPMAAQGEEIKAGAEAALEEINAAGGIRGEKLALTIHDDICNATQATVVANKIITDAPMGMIGHLCSAATLAAAPIYAETGFPQITFSSNPKITESGYTHLVRLVGRDDQQAPDLIDYMAAHLPENFKIAVLDDKGSWGLGFADLAVEALGKKAIPIVFRDSITSGQKDFSSLITRLKTENITTVVMGLYVTEGALLVRQAREQGFTGSFYGGDPLQTPEFAKVAGPASNGVMQSGLFDPRNTENGKKLLAKLEVAHKGIGVYTFYAYAAVHIYADALAKATDAKPKTLSAQLKNQEFDTLLGKVSFNAKGDMKDFKYRMFIWKDGNVAPLEN